MNKGFDRVPTGTVLSYGAGQVGAQIFRDTPAVLLPIFMTTLLGVPPWLSGIVILIPKLWVIMCDPLVGSWSDRLKGRVGRTAFLSVGAVLTAVSFLSLFTVTSYSSPTVAALAICALFFLGSTAFSIYSVPYLAIASELSGDPHERTRILMYRMMFTVAGVVIGVGAAQPLILAFGGGASGWHVMAISFSVLCLVSMLVPVFGLRKANLAVVRSGQDSLLEQLRSVAGNKPYLVLLATWFTQNIGLACSYTVLGFVFLYALDAVHLMPVFVLVMSAGSLLSQPIWLKLSRRYGKERCFVAAALVWVGVTITWFFAHPGTDVLVNLPILGALATQHVLVLLRAFLIGLFNAGFLMLTMSMMTDTVDYQRRVHGVAHEGVFAGMFSAAEKLAFALGPLIAGFVLSLQGFQASTVGVVSQSKDAVTGVLLLYSFIPAGLQVVALLVFSRYRLHGDSPAQLMTRPVG